MHEKVVWRVFVKDAGAELNFFRKKMRRRKNGLKQRREGNGPSLQSQLSILCYTEPRCDYVGQFNAGQVKHTRKRHAWVQQLLPSLLWPIQKTGTIQTNASDSARETPRENIGHSKLYLET